MVSQVGSDTARPGRAQNNQAASSAVMGLVTLNEHGGVPSATPSHVPASGRQVPPRLTRTRVVPRQHLERGRWQCAKDALARSTRAGGLIPGNAGRVRATALGRRHSLNEGCGVVPGNVGLRLVSAESDSSLNEGRGRSPFNALAPRLACCKRSTPLNEGRGLSPGNTAR
jgi:hypothetical protein